ncbi:MAG: hypothetical protein ACJZ8Q_06900 [Paracoccaceae bacterium]
MVQKNIPTKDIFFTQKSSKNLDKNNRPIFLILILIWILILVSMIILTSLIDINDKFFIYFFILNLLALVGLVIKINTTLLKKIDSIESTISRIAKKVSQSELIKAEKESSETIKYYKDPIDSATVLSNQTKLENRISDLENKIYPHIQLQERIGADENSSKSIKRQKIEPISVQDLIGALNFPKDEDDTEGFRKLRRALADSENGDLLRASQDVQTLLSQEGIYMDDLTDQDSEPELWRRFSNGERGRKISPLSIDDDEYLLPIKKKLQDDDIFKDATYHFLRHFDSSLQDFCKKASDIEITRFSNTRTARAFKVLGTATGRFK